MKEQVKRVFKSYIVCQQTNKQTNKKSGTRSVLNFPQPLKRCAGVPIFPISKSMHSFFVAFTFLKKNSGQDEQNGKLSYCRLPL